MKRLFATGVLLARAACWAGLGLSSLFGTFALAQNQQNQLKSAASPANSSPLLHLFYIGKRQSQMIPCGCRTKQVGGLPYEAPLYAKYGDAPSVRVDAGEWASIGVGQRPELSMQTRFLLRGLARLGLDAVNVGLTDIELSAEYFKDFSQQYPKEIPNFVSANIFLKDQPGQHAFHTERIIKRKLADGREITIGITGAAALHSAYKGLTQPAANAPAQVETSSYVARQPKECLKPILAQLRPKVDILIVLLAGDLTSSVEVAKAFPQIDYLIVNGGYKDPLSAMEGKVHILCVQNNMGKELGLANLAWNPTQKWFLKDAITSLPVAKDLKPDAGYLALINEFKLATRKLEVKLPPDNVQRVYSGVVNCADCHKGPFKQWQATRHAHALVTLVNKGQEYNPECLKCHTTGFRQFNGFYAYSHIDSQQMFNVQCEVCHGPAQEHMETQMQLVSRPESWMSKADYQALLKRAKKTMPQKKVPESVCLKCHTPENDNHFVYSTKLPKIAHKSAPIPASQGEKKPN